MNRKKKKKVFHNNNKNMDNLHFIPNNIITILCKELQNIKMTINSIKLYIYELYYASYCISLSIFMHMHGVTN